jgi:hypothetical protein
MCTDPGRVPQDKEFDMVDLDEMKEVLKAHRAKGKEIESQEDTIPSVNAEQPISLTNREIEKNCRVPCS